MSTLNSKSIELLAELRNICNENGFRYYLSPMTAARAFMYGGFGYRFCVPSVAMPFDDAMKFKKLIDGNTISGRMIECMENNPEYSSFSLSYVNTDTTLIDLIRGTDFRQHGVRVDIELLRPRTNDRGLRCWEVLWDCNAYLRVLSVKHRWVNKPAHAIIGILKYLGKTASLYRTMCRTYEGRTSDKYLLKAYYMTAAGIPTSMFDQTSEIEFEGESFTVPADVEGYIYTATNGTWKAVLEEPEKMLQEYIFYDNIPCAEMETALRNDGDSIDTVFRKSKDLYMDTDEKVSYNSGKKRLWDIANRSGIRAILYVEMNRQIDRIRSLYQEEKYEELEQIFSEYDKELHKYLDLDLGLCPCKELMDIECELMKRRGENDKVNRLLELVPPQHYRSVFGD